jgi:hypothetical protein
MDKRLHSTEGMATTSFDSSLEQSQQQKSEFLEGQNSASVPDHSPDHSEQKIAEDTRASATNHSSEDVNPNPTSGSQHLGQITGGTGNSTTQRVSSEPD